MNDFSSIVAAVKQHADVIIFDTRASVPTQDDDDNLKIRSLIAQSHHILVPVRIEPASVVDGAVYLDMLIDDLHTDRNRIWVIKVGGELRNSGLDPEVWEHMAPKRHERIPPARQLIEETVNAGYIPVLANRRLKESYRTIIRRLMLDYNRQHRSGLSRR